MGRKRRADGGRGPRDGDAGGWYRRSGAGDIEEPATTLHEERLDAVVELLVAAEATSVADLGCGTGALLRRLIGDARFTRILGIDSSVQALAQVERMAEQPEASGRLEILHGSFLDVDQRLREYDAATLVETIEHLEPGHLSRLERAVFSLMQPRLVVITTPNRDFNERLGLAGTAKRHADHRFEWGRARFEAWAAGVAERNGYAVQFQAVGPADRWNGGPTQLAVFRR
jgi:small RNA 2'-O-methyltransferase